MIIKRNSKENEKNLKYIYIETPPHIPPNSIQKYIVRSEVPTHGPTSLFFNFIGKIYIMYKILLFY